jgi:cardiolipin synthase
MATVSEPRTRRRGEDRIATVPNFVTLIRLLCVPVFLWLMLRPHRSGWYPAALLLGVLGATDGVDGYVARHFGQVSTLGKVLDPVADRLLLGVAGITTIVLGAVPLWVGVTAMAREGLVAAGFLAVAAIGGARMDVQWAGKAGTFALMCAFPLFVAGHAHDDWHRVAEALAWVFVIPGLGLGWYAAVTYIPKARLAVEAGRRSRSGRHARDRAEEANL